MHKFRAALLCRLGLDVDFESCMIDFLMKVAMSLKPTILEVLLGDLDLHTDPARGLHLGDVALCKTNFAES